MTGDFNARTSNQKDYIQTDDFLSDFFDFDSDTLEFFSHVYKLDTLNVIKDRSSQDKHKNNSGYKLLNMCKNNNLFIVNGRIGHDKAKVDIHLEILLL